MISLHRSTLQSKTLSGLVPIRRRQSHAEFLLAIAEKSDDSLPECGAALGAAEGIDLQSEVLKPEAAKKMHQHQDEFGIDVWVIRAQDFGIDLMELTVSSLLRSLPAEHRPDREELCYRFGGGKSVLQIGADDGRRRLRAERQGFLATVNEGIHLFLDDIGGFPYSAAEEFGLFQKGNADLAEPEGTKNIGGRNFDMPPFVGFRRENILEPLDGGDDLH